MDVVNANNVPEDEDAINEEFGEKILWLTERLTWEQRKAVIEWVSGVLDGPLNPNEYPNLDGLP